jgi:NADH:ubiquinone oxidoreductase subunit F (NADH-binding)/NADH:ubiquinone oxidoreductase subunit E
MPLEFSEKAQKQIERLLTRYPTRQATLLGVLYVAQDEFGYLSEEALGLVSRTLDLPLSHVFGVATFYTLFLRQPPARYPLHVCTNLGCSLRGGHDVLRHLEKRLGIAPGQTTPDGLFSLGEEDGLGGCAYAPTMTCGPHHYVNLTHERVDRVIDDLRRKASETEAQDPSSSCVPAPGVPTLPACGSSGSGYRETPGLKIVTKNFGVPDIQKLPVYRAHGGWQAFEKALGMGREKVVEEVKKSNLRGRGGAGFPAGVKWGFLPKDVERVYLVCNGDESEPGTFKDRVLLGSDPHLLIEGVSISAFALGCTHAFIYIRGELRREADIVQAAIDEAYAAGWLGQKRQSASGSCKLDITVHLGAGAYICGEETAMLESIEGKRGWPRNKPPFPASKGLFGQPTVVNNVETLMNVPDIVSRGGDWFAKAGMGKSGGTRLLCVSGHVKRPGVYELPMGISFREVIYDVCGGIFQGRALRGVIPGGSSMPPLDATEIDVPIEFDALTTDSRIRDVEVKPGVPFDLGGGRRLKTMAGSGGVVAFDENTDVVALCARIMRFYAHESCGQCTPCREGTGWLARVCTRLAEGEGRPGDIELLADVANGIAGNSICALGEAAAWPMLGFLTKFRADFEARLPKPAKAS